MLFSNTKINFKTIFKKEIIILLLLIMISVVIRFLYFPDNVYFGYDQARDAFVSTRIFSEGDFKIQGPTSSGAGIYHGPLLYYVLGSFYTIAEGDPAKVLIFFILLNALSVPLIYILSKSLTGSAMVALISAILFTFSFEQTQWAIFQSNTSLASFGVLLFLTGLSLAWFSKQKLGILISAFGLGIAFQSEIYLIYLLPLAFLLWYFYFKQKLFIDKKIVIISALILLAFSSTYILSELLFKFPTLNSVLNSLGGNSNYDSTTFLVNTFLDRLGLATYYSVFGFSPFLAFIFLLATIYVLWKIKGNDVEGLKIFTLTWLFSSILLTVFGAGFANIYHFSIGISLIIIVLASIALNYWLKSKYLLALVVLVLILGQLKLIINQNVNGATLTLVQKGMLLGSEKQVIDYVYKNTSNSPVSIASLSNPYNINTVWAYTFKLYWNNDKPFPYWQRDFAKGFEGEKVFSPTPAKELCDQFVIYENVLGLDSSIAAQFDLEQSYKSEIIEEKQFGAIKVQKRKSLDCE